MTVNITGEMLKGKTEAELLRMALSLYALSHPLENERQAVALICKCSVGLIVKAVDGIGHLGADSWLRIEEELGVNIYREWISERAKK